MAEEKKYSFKGEDDKEVVPLIAILLVLIVLVGGVLYYLISYQAPQEEQPTQQPPVQPEPEQPEPEEPPVEVCDDECHYDIAIMNQSIDECKKIENNASAQECYEQLSDVSLAACLEVQDQDKKDFCVSSFAVINDDIDLCDLLEGDVKENCRKQVDECIGVENEDLCRALKDEDASECKSDDCVLNYSITKQDASSCGLITSSAVEKGCESAIKDTDKCYDLTEESKRNYCYQIYATYSDNYKVCSSITSNSMYHVDCLSMFAVSQSNASICRNDGLTLDNLWSCYTKYALASGDLGGCDLIDKLATTNRFKCAFEYAKKFGNPAACQVVQSLATRDTCYQGAIIYSSENLDPQYCPEITNFEWRNKCYNEAAKMYDDIEICEEIENDNAYLACISAYHVYKENN